MPILILNCKPREIANYDEWLQDCEEELLLLNDRETVAQFDAANYHYVEAFDNYDHNMNLYRRALQLYDAYSYHTVVAIDEFDIYPSSLLRERLQIAGQKPASARQFRDKVLMKSLAQSQGLKVPSFRAIQSVFDLIDFIDQHGYPVIVKPVDGASAVNTTILNDSTELEAILAKGLPANMEVEQYVEGDFHHVDGIVLDGELSFICVSRMLKKGCISYKEGEGIGAYLLNPDHPIGKRIVEYTTQLLQVLDTPVHTTFHAEVFHSVDDEIVLCEIASRTGGVRINREIEYGYGVNLNQLLIRQQCGLPIERPQNPPLQQLTGYILIPPKQGTIQTLPTEPPPEWVLEYRCLVQPGQECQEPQGAIDEIASFVVQGSSEEEVQTRLRQAADWFAAHSSWC